MIDVIERYGGKIYNITDDNVMAVFHTANADDDLLHSVRAALDIQQIMSERSGEDGPAVQAHIGIARGEVIANGTGSEPHRDYTVTDDSVNLGSGLITATR